MDAFYASVEQRDRPELRGKPVAVGGDPNKRGVVAAASYEARVVGVRSAIPMARAVRLCPHLLVAALWAVGPVTAARLRERGIERLVDVRTVDPGLLRDAVGIQAEWLRPLADGIDDRAVEPNRETKSSGSENTYSHDLTDINEIRQEIDAMARDAAEWLAKTELLCRTVTIKVRYSDFTTITRSHSKTPATREGEDIAQRAVKLLDRTDAAGRPVRLLGVSVHNLEDPSAPFEAEEPMLPF